MISPRVGLLYDSVSLNTGDIAIGVALQQQLVKRSITSEIIDPFNYTPSDFDSIIVGGGQIIRDSGDDFYDNFRLSGPYILNSVGVSASKNFKFLRKYKLLSARSTFEADIIKRELKRDVEVIPCTTTLLESDPYTIPGLTTQPDEKVVGIHLVPDVLIMCPDIIQIINSIPHKKVLIPFTHYNQDASFMKHLPIDYSNAILLDKLEPLELHSVLSQMSYVIVSSLHASIFSYSQNVPFISMYQKKTHDYFQDRSLEKYVYSTQEQLVELIKEIEVTPPDLHDIVESDRIVVTEYLDRIASLISTSGKNRATLNKSPRLVDGNRTTHQLELKLKQLEMVVEKRDVLIHNVIYQNIRANEIKLEELRSVIADMNSRLDELNTSLQEEKNKRMVDHIKLRLRKYYKDL